MKECLFKMIIACYVVGLFMSCSSDSEDDLSEKGDGVLISAVCPDVNIETNCKQRCILEIRSKAEPDKPLFRKGLLAGDELGKFVFELSLPAGSYQCMLWMDYVDTDDAETDKFYDTSNLDDVIAKNPNMLLNNEAGVAFYYVGDLEKKDLKLQAELTLKPAVAKISIQENNRNELKYLKAVTASFNTFIGFNVTAGTVIEDNKLQVNFENQNFNLETSTEGTLFSTYVFADELQHNLGEIKLSLTKSISSTENKKIDITIPDIISLVGGQHIKVNASMMEDTERENEFDIIYDIDVEDWTESNVDITKPSGE